MDCMKFLIEELKVDVNLASETGWTPLHLSSRAKPENRALDCVHYLLQQGADPNKVSDLGISSAHQAVAADNIHCLSTLVRSGAIIGEPDKRGLLPVDVAKVWGHSDCTKYLQNIMWFQQKKKDELDRRKWVQEHQKSLEREIKKYSDHRNSPIIEKDFQQWASKKGIPVQKVPANCLSRARPKSCYKESEIPDVWMIKMVKQTTPERKTIPLIRRDQLERVKKIQSLQNSQDKLTTPASTSPVALSGDKCQQVQLHERKIKKSLTDSVSSRKTEPPRVLKKKKKKKSKSVEENTRETNISNRRDILMSVLKEAMTNEQRLKLEKSMRYKQGTQNSQNQPKSKENFSIDIDSYFRDSKQMTESVPVTSVSVKSNSTFLDTHATVKCSEAMIQPPHLQQTPSSPQQSSPRQSSPQQPDSITLEDLTKDLSEAELTKRTVRFADRVKYEYDAFERSPRQSISLPIVSFDSSLQLRSCLKTNNNNISFY